MNTRKCSTVPDTLMTTMVMADTPGLRPLGYPHSPGQTTSSLPCGGPHVLGTYSLGMLHPNSPG